MADHYKTPDIMAFGEAMVELNQTREESAWYLQGFGGDTSNFCVAAARSGARTAYVSAVGDDRFGHLLRDLWRREGIDDRHVITEAELPTGVYFVSHDEGGHHFEYRRAGSAASRYNADDLPRDAIASAKFLHVSGVSLAIGEGPREAAFAAMAHARAHGVRVSFDTNLRLRLWSLDRARIVMQQALTLTDICLPSWDDVTALTGLDDRDAIVDALLGAGAGIVALKLGCEGAYIATAETRALVAPHVVPAIDATGAGDCFGGAFVARLLDGDAPLEAARYANVAAALSTLGYGAVDPIPRAEQVRAALSG